MAYRRELQNYNSELLCNLRIEFKKKNTNCKYHMHRRDYELTRLVMSTVMPFLGYVLWFRVPLVPFLFQ